MRRLTPADVGGAAGSRPDVLCRVPAAAAAKGTPISIPIEVKLSLNPEARTGLREQLAGRYMPQTAATGGVFVLVWFDAPGLAPRHRPIWPTIAEARLKGLGAHC